MASTATNSILEAMKEVPSMKENLKKAFEDLQSFSPSLLRLPFQWSDIDGHFSSINLCISHLKPDAEAMNTLLTTSPKDLASLKGTRVGPRVLLEPGEALLGIRARVQRLGGRGWAEREVQDGLRVPAGGPAGGNRAVGEGWRKGSGGGWKRRVGEDATVLDVHLFLRFLAAFELAPVFDAEEVMELLARMSRKMKAVGLCRELGLGDRMPVLRNNGVFGASESNNALVYSVQKLSHRFQKVLQNNEKVLGGLLAHLEAAKKAAQELCDRGDNSIQSLNLLPPQNEAIAKELDALRDVIKNIEMSKLEAQYPPKPLKIRVAELEQSKLNVKRAVSTMIESSTKQPQQEKQQKRRRRAMKRPHLFNAITVVAPSASAHSRSSYQAASVGTEMDQTRYTENKRLSDEDQELLRLEPLVAAAPLKSRRARARPQLLGLSDEDQERGTSSSSRTKETSTAGQEDVLCMQEAGPPFAWMPDEDDELLQLWSDGTQAHRVSNVAIETSLHAETAYHMYGVFSLYIEHALFGHSV
ncbi:hypothetical protein QJS10_CPB17g02065 [Acorus calamus]|uniref:FRIGIDA-like protein n=1 Tax=Acorus calamus TaxID=4465 RepID=A0AAV9CVQ5_ACOCL|nr:hypothetical protein QJS10_CPB17g02065 [Acorus calamus]